MDIEELRQLVTYDPNTGEIRSAVRISRRIKAGSIMGFPAGRGYIRVKIRGRKYYAHRLAFALYHGYFPEYVDHVNRNRSDNRIVNLRAASQSQNSANSKGRKGTSKYKGVCFATNNNKWKAQIQVMYKSIHLGFFDSEESAAMSYDDAAIEYFGEFARVNFQRDRK